MSVAILRDLVVTRVDLVDLGENQAADIVLFKRRKEESEVKEGLDLTKIPEDQRPVVAALQKRAGDADTAEELARKAEDRAVAAEKERDELKAKVDAQTLEQVEKARLATLPEEVRKRLEANEVEIAKLRDDKETGEFVAKARELPLSSTTAEAFGPLLRRIAKGCTTPEDATEISRVVKAMGEQIKMGEVFGERGRSGGAAPDGAYEEARALAKAKVEAGKFTTIEKAMSAVWAEKPDLWKRYREEGR
jgi:DNA-binding ferritin-like protein